MMADDDGFITAKSPRKKRSDPTITTIKAANNNMTVITKPQNKLRERNTENAIRFGGKQWSKPSIVTTTVTSTTLVTSAELRVAASLPPSIQSQSPSPLLVPFSSSFLSSSKSTPTTDETNSLFNSQSTHLVESQSSIPSSNALFGIHMMENISDSDMTKTMWPGQQPQSLASLLEDYGTYDPNWMKVEPTNMVDDNKNNFNDGREKSTEKTTILAEPTAEEDPQQQSVDETTPTIVDGINRLQLHGHAPIHVEFVSFGYRYGIPSEIRYYSTGNCYTQPLLPFDTRTVLAPIPNYLSHIDGKAGIIKNTMLKWRSVEKGSDHSLISSKQLKANDEYKNCMNVRDYVNESIIPPVADAITEAIDIGQHGYVSPITISIYIGSELGKHRSVVTAELSAVALRKLLRRNQYNRFHCPVSVAGRHRDILNSQSHAHTNTTKAATSKKQRAFEEDD